MASLCTKRAKKHAHAPNPTDGTVLSILFHSMTVLSPTPDVSEKFPNRFRIEQQGNHSLDKDLIAYVFPIRVMLLPHAIG